MQERDRDQGILYIYILQYTVMKIKNRRRVIGHGMMLGEKQSHPPNPELLTEYRLVLNTYV